MEPIFYSPEVRKVEVVIRPSVWHHTGWVLLL